MDLCYWMCKCGWLGQLQPEKGEAPLCGRSCAEPSLSVGMHDSELVFNAEETFLIGNLLYRMWTDFPPGTDPETGSPIERFLDPHFFRTVNERLGDRPEARMAMWEKICACGVY